MLVVLTEVGPLWEVNVSFTHVRNRITLFAPILRWCSLLHTVERSWLSRRAELPHPHQHSSRRALSVRNLCPPLPGRSKGRPHWLQFHTRSGGRWLVIVG